MPLELSLRPATGVQRYLITIGDADFFLRIKYFKLAESVYLDIADADEQPIVSGVRCVFGFPFTIYNRDPRLPGGTFSMVRSESRDDRCAIADVGFDVKLYHWTDEELTADAVAADAEVLNVVPLP